MKVTDNLTQREMKILVALSYGNLYKEIANDYGISINTVKKHLKNVYKKLDVKKRKDAIAKLHESNLAGEQVAA